MWIWASRYPIWYETPLLKDVAGLGVPRQRRMACEQVIFKFALAPFGFRQSGPLFSWASKSTRLCPHVFTIQTMPHCFPQQNLTALSFWKREKKKIPRVFFTAYQWRRWVGNSPEVGSLWLWNQEISQSCPQLAPIISTWFHKYSFFQFPSQVQTDRPVRETKYYVVKEEEKKFNKHFV